MSLSILDVLEKKGSMSDVDLQKEIKSNFGEVSFRELNRELMKLELAGILRVSRLSKGKRLVELTGKPVFD
jgi:DNA-binding PadR family transcriptional regulator